MAEYRHTHRHKNKKHNHAHTHTHTKRLTVTVAQVAHAAVVDVLVEGQSVDGRRQIVTQTLIEPRYAHATRLLMAPGTPRVMSPVLLI